MRAWSDMVTVIGGVFDIGPRSPSKPKSKVLDPFDLPDEDTSVTRSRLPLYPALSQAIHFMEKEMKAFVPAKGKDPGSMPTGKFPKVDKSKKAHPLSSLPSFT